MPSFSTKTKTQPRLSRLERETKLVLGPFVLAKVMQPLHVASSFGSFHKTSSAAYLRFLGTYPHSRGGIKKGKGPSKTPARFAVLLLLWRAKQPCSAVLRMGDF